MKRSSQTIRLAIVLLLVLLAQACVQLKAGTPPAAPVNPDGGTPAAQEVVNPLPTPTATFELPTPTAAPTQPSATPAPSVTITAIKGNLFIRRGPDMAFNPVGVLYKDTSAKVIARDVLSDWAQIQIPNSGETGWVSTQTSYSQVEGSLEDLPGFTTTEWPLAAYLRNCTHHRMYVPEADMVIPSSYEFPDNEVWIYPGTYTVLDIDVAGDPEVLDFTIREGENVEIRWDGSGEKRKCP
ncbi:MAG: SH3 domain-containing protein [Chloroflexi bacterium]|nr:SH3 domain-containing protein [Chloroflexota bacterium]